MAVNESSTTSIFFFRAELDGGPWRAESSARSLSDPRSLGVERRIDSGSRVDRDEAGAALGGGGKGLLAGVGGVGVRGVRDGIGGIGVPLNGEMRSKGSFGVDAGVPDGGLPLAGLPSAGLSRRPFISSLRFH